MKVWRIMDKKDNLVRDFVVCDDWTPTKKLLKEQFDLERFLEVDDEVLQKPLDTQNYTYIISRPQKVKIFIDDYFIVYECNLHYKFYLNASRNFYKLYRGHKSKFKFLDCRN